MPAPASETYHVDALVAAQTSFRDLIDAGSGAGKLRIRSASDTLLSTIPLSDPCGTINSGTGKLTITASGPDTSAAATGTAAYGEFCDSDNKVILALPAQSGSVAVAGKLVLNTLAIVAGNTVELVSFTVG